MSDDVKQPSVTVPNGPNPVLHTVTDEFLRDYFAGQALAGMLAAYSGENTTFPPEDSTAKLAFRFADALLEARKR